MSEETEELIYLTDKTAFVEGTKIPAFGRFKSWGNIEIFNNYNFYKTAGSRVLLKSTEANHLLSIPSDDYAKIVKICSEAIATICKVEKDSFEYKKAYLNLYANLLTDKNKYRFNLAYDFIHNYSVSCSDAISFGEAIDFGKRLIDNYDTFNKKLFYSWIKTFKKGQFEKRLLRIYKEKCVYKDFTYINLLKDETIPIENSWKLKADEAEKHPDDYQLKNGEKIGKSPFSVGEIVRIEKPISSFKGKTWIPPISDYKIMQASKGIKPERIVIYSNELKSTYFVTIKELKELVKKSAKNNKYAFEQFSLQEKLPNLDEKIIKLIETMNTSPISSDSIDGYIQEWCQDIEKFTPYYQSFVEILIEDREKKLSKNLRKAFADSGYDFFQTLLAAAEYTMKKYYGNYEIIPIVNNEEKTINNIEEEQKMNSVIENNQKYAENSTQDIAFLTQTIKNLQNQVQNLQAQLSNALASNISTNSIPQWEYKIVDIREDGGFKLNSYGQIIGNTKSMKGDYAKEYMTENDWKLLGQAGWEVVASISNYAGGITTGFMLKRPRIEK